MYAASKVILRYRADNRLQKIRKLLGNANTREKVKEIVRLDWQKAEYFGIGKKDHVIFDC